MADQPLPEIVGFTLLPSCLACGSALLKRYLDLGTQPLANSFHDGRQLLQGYPLAISYCPACFHSQLGLAVDPNVLFRDYPYVSGTSRSLREYFKRFADDVVRDSGLLHLKILEIGCNDGTLLKEFARRGHDCHGVDPAENLALTAVSGHHKVTLTSGFWNEDTAEIAMKRAGGPFDVIIAMNVLGHVADPLGFLKAAKQVLAPGGRLYVQTSQARMLELGQFDAIYAEHISYFTARSFHVFARRNGWEIRNITLAPVHGLSYLVEMIPATSYNVGFYSLVEMEESSLGYYGPDIYKRFGEMAAHIKDGALKTVEAMRGNGYHVVGYGAAAKGMTFLNYTGIELDFIVDDNPRKIGLRCPGSNIPVLGPDILEQTGDRCCWIVLPWNMKDEIIARIKAKRPDRHDLFVTFFPRLGIQ